MILDSGVATFYHKTNTAGPGEKPIFTNALFFTGYYGELSYETNPRYQTEKREDVRTDARIRVLQNRGIMNRDTCTLEPVNGNGGYYEVTRVWHGTDDESGELISDISLARTAPAEVMP